MVFTHLPANVCLMIVPFVGDLGVAVALLLVRSLLSQMDVPTRTSYVMAVVTPAERPAAASVTAVPRSLASALGPTFGGLLLAAGPFAWPLFLGGALKAVYDLTLLLMFRHVKPPRSTDSPPTDRGSRPTRSLCHLHHATEERSCTDRRLRRSMIACSASSPSVSAAGPGCRMTVDLIS